MELIIVIIVVDLCMGWQIVQFQSYTMGKDNNIIIIIIIVTVC